MKNSFRADIGAHEISAIFGKFSTGIPIYLLLSENESIILEGKFIHIFDDQICRHNMRELIAMRGSRYGAGVSWCIRRVIHIFNGCRTSSICAILVICLVHLSFVQAAVSGVNHNEFLAQLKVPQCRKDCTDKVSVILFSYEMSSFCFYYFQW